MWGFQQVDQVDSTGLAKSQTKKCTLKDQGHKNQRREQSQNQREISQNKNGRM